MGQANFKNKKVAATIHMLFPLTPEFISMEYQQTKGFCQVV